MVPALPILVLNTAIKIYGVGFNFNLSQTWKISVDIKIMEVTSSTAQANKAEAIDVTKINFLPVNLGIDTISWTIQVKKPKSLNAPTIIIIPTKNMITSKDEDMTKRGMFKDPDKISTARPKKAIANLKVQKNNVPKIIAIKTPQAKAC